MLIAASTCITCNVYSLVPMIEHYMHACMCLVFVHISMVYNVNMNTKRVHSSQRAKTVAYASSLSPSLSLSVSLFSFRFDHTPFSLHHLYLFISKYSINYGQIFVPLTVFFSGIMGASIIKNGHNHFSISVCLRTELI